MNKDKNIQYRDENYEFVFLSNYGHLSLAKRIYRQKQYLVIYTIKIDFFLKIIGKVNKINPAPGQC